jgi:hypothetical protein
MTKQILQVHDHAGNAIINFVVENLAAYPSAGNAGRFVLNTTTNEIGFDNGTAFLPLLTAVAWNDVTGKPTTFAPSAHTHAISEVTGLQGALDDKAPLASPGFTGNPTAPTQTIGNNTTRLATTAFVMAAIGAAGGGDMLISVYDSNSDGKVDAADTADAAPWAGITGKPSTFAPSAHTHAQSEITGLVTALAGKSDTGHTHTAADVTDFATAVNTQIIAYWDSIAGTDANVDTIREVLDLVLQNASDITSQIGRFNATIGNGASTSIAVTHNLGSLDVSVEVYDIGTGETVGVGVTRTNTNVVTIEAIPAPATNSLRVVIKR